MSHSKILVANARIHFAARRPPRRSRGKTEQLTENVLQGMLDGLENCIPTVPEGVLGGTSACLMKHPKLRARRLPTFWMLALGLVICWRPSA